MTGLAELVLAIIGGWFMFSIGLGVLLVVQRTWRERRPLDGELGALIAPSTTTERLH